MKVAPTNEILGTLLSDSLGGSSDINELKNNPQEFIFSKANVEVKSTDISIVENSDKEVGLCLPYYEALDAMGSATVMSDDNLDEVAGGEVIGFIIAVCAVGGGIAAGATALGTGLHYGLVEKHKHNK